MSTTVRNLVFSFCFATLFSAFGCSKDKGTDSNATAKATKPAQPKFIVPKNVLMYTGTDSPEKTLAALFGIATKVTPLTPDPRPMIPPLVAGVFRLANPMGIDLNKPLRFVLFDPKGLGRDPSALIIGLKKDSKLEDLVGKIERKQNDRGNLWSYKKRKTAKIPVFVNAVKGHFVLTRHPDTYPKNKAFIEALLKTPMKDSGFLSAQLNHATTQFKPQLDKGIRQIKDSFRRNPQTAQNADKLAAVVDGIQTFLNEVSAIELSLKIDPEGIRIASTWLPQEKSGLAKTWKELKNAPHALLAKTPATASGVLSMAWTGPAYERFAKASLAFSTSLTAGGSKSAVDLGMEYSKLLNGQSSMFLFTPPSGKGLMGSLLAGITDQKKAVEAFEKYQAELQANPEFQKLMEQSGIKTQTQKDPEPIGNLPTFLSQTTILKPGVANPAAMLGMDRISFAFGKTEMMMAFGPKAKAIIEDQNAGTLKGFNTSKAGARVLKQAAENPLVIGYISPINVAKQARLGGMNPFAKTLAGIKSESGISLSIGHKEGQLLTVLDVPTQLLVDSFQVFERVKGSF